MKKYIVLIVIFVSFSMLFAEFGNNLQTGVRQQGMGNAFTGLADDGEAVYFNHAGLINLRNIEGIVMYSNLLNGLDMHDDMSANVSYLGYAQNLGDKIGSIGIRWFYSGQTQGDYYDASENNIMIAYGRTLMDIFSLDKSDYLENLSVGLGFKMLGWGFYDNPSMGYLGDESEFTSWNMAMEFSLYYKMNNKFSFGFIIKDFVNVKLAETEEVDSDYSDPIDLRVGGAWKYNPKNSMDVVVLDFSMENEESTINIGSERVFELKFDDATDLIFARGGSQIGFDGYYSLNLGFGYQLVDMGEKLNFNLPFDLRFDYALKVSFGEVEETPMNHSMQLSFFMGHYTNSEVIDTRMGKIPVEIIEEENSDDNNEASGEDGSVEIIDTEPEVEPEVTPEVVPEVEPEIEPETIPEG